MMTKEQQREAIRLLRVVAAASMGRTSYSPRRELWIGWQEGELEGVGYLERDARKLLDSLTAARHEGGS
jgi:hypothetical protein